MTANQLAVLLAFYRGLGVALDGERWRGNYEEDVRALMGLGFLAPVVARSAAPHIHLYEVTIRGDQFIRECLRDAIV